MLDKIRPAHAFIASHAPALGAAADLAHALGETAEDSAKLLAEAAFLSAFIKARRGLAG